MVLRTMCRDGAARAHDAGLRAELAAIAERLELPLQLAVAGAVSAGKSTLINAILGRPVAAVDAGECTRVVTWYEYGPEPGLLVEEVAGRVRHLRLPDTGLPENLGVPTEDVLRLRVRLPMPWLRTVTVIDTPGLNTVGAATEEATRRLLFGDAAAEHAQALLYVLRYVQRFDADTLTQFRALSAACGLTAVNTAAVLSQIDRRSDDPDPWPVAHRLTARATTELGATVLDVAPVIGLLAETARARLLRPPDLTALHTLAECSPAEFEDALFDLEEFTDGYGPLPAAEARALVDRLHRYGITIAVDHLRRHPTATLDDLYRLLVTHSGFAPRTAEGRQGVTANGAARPDLGHGPPPWQRGAATERGTVRPGPGQTSTPCQVGDAPGIGTGDGCPRPGPGPVDTPQSAVSAVDGVQDGAAAGSGFEHDGTGQREGLSAGEGGHRASAARLSPARSGVSRSGTPEPDPAQGGVRRQVSGPALVDTPAGRGGGAGHVRVGGGYGSVGSDHRTFVGRTEIGKTGIGGTERVEEDRARSEVPSSPTVTDVLDRFTRHADLLKAHAALVRLRGLGARFPGLAGPDRALVGHLLSAVDENRPIADELAGLRVLSACAAVAKGVLVLDEAMTAELLTLVRGDTIAARLGLAPDASADEVVHAARAASRRWRQVAFMAGSTVAGHRARDVLAAVEDVAEAAAPVGFERALVERLRDESTLTEGDRRVVRALLDGVDRLAMTGAVSEVDIAPRAAACAVRFRELLHRPLPTPVRRAVEAACDAFESLAGT